VAKEAKCRGEATSFGKYQFGGTGAKNGG
jgi:hypothetical protein